MQGGGNNQPGLKRKTIKRLASVTTATADTLETAQTEVDDGWKVYQNSLLSAIQVLPQPQTKEYQQLMTRISDGFNLIHAKCEKMVTRLHEVYGVELRNQESKLKNTEAEYAEFRKNNDLEGYFAKNLSDESKERVLENIKQLMIVTDWGYHDISSL